AVVAGDDDDRVVQQPQVLQAVTDPAHVVVDVAHRRVVGAPSPAHLVGGGVLPVEAAHLPQPVGVRVCVGTGHLRVCRIGDLPVGEPVPMLLRRRVGVARVDEAGDHQEGDVLAGRLVGPYPVVEVAQRAEAYLVVEVLLHGGLGDTGGEDGVGVVVPLQPLVQWPVPVRDHVHVRGVDIGGEALFAAVVLVRTAEMHPAHQRRVVPGAAQVVGESGHRGGEIVPVVVAAQ